MDMRAVGGRIVGKNFTFTLAEGTAASNGDNTLIAAPGSGFRLVIKDLVVQNESSTDTTVILKDGSASCWRALLLAVTADALPLSFAPGEEWRLSEDAALVLNLSGANSHGYSVRYFTEHV